MRTKSRSRPRSGKRSCGCGCGCPWTWHPKALNPQGKLVRVCMRIGPLCACAPCSLGRHPPDITTRVRAIEARQLLKQARQLRNRARS
jgi:hypothetical protein